MPHQPAGFAGRLGLRLKFFPTENILLIVEPFQREDDLGGKTLDQRGAFYDNFNLAGVWIFSVPLEHSAVLRVVFLFPSTKNLQHGR